MSFLDNNPNYVIIHILINLFYNISLFVGTYAGDL